VKDGTLVPSNAKALGWPKILARRRRTTSSMSMDYDYGPDFRYSDESGVMTKVVPSIKQIIPTPAARWTRTATRSPA